jgi:peroxiredoxin
MRTLFRVMACALCGWMAVSTAFSAIPGKLQWRSGQSMPGTLVRADAKHVEFQPFSPAEFPQPARIDLRRVAELTLDPPPGGLGESKQNARWLVRLRDGSMLLARSFQVKDSLLRVASDWLGDADFALDSVREVISLDKDSVLFHAPAPGVPWGETIQLADSGIEYQEQDPFAPAFDPPLVASPRRGGTGERNAVKLWVARDDGSLATSSWNNTLTTALSAPADNSGVLKLPGVLCFHLQLSSDSGPAAFSLRWMDSEHELRLETWNDRLVLRVDDSFAAAARALTDADSDLKLRVCWSRAAGRAALFAASGERLAFVTAGTPPPTPDQPRDEDPFASNNHQRPPLPNIHLENLGIQLALHELRITAGAGDIPAKLPPWLLEAGAVMRDGSIQAGAPLAVSSGGWELGEPSTATGRLEDLERLQPGATRDGFVAPPKGSARLGSHFGETLAGELVGMDLNQGEYSAGIRIRHPAAAEPVSALPRLTGRITLPAEDPPLVDDPLPDRLVGAGEVTLSGRVAHSDGPLPLWQFDGAADPVPVGAAFSGIIHLSRERPAPAPGVTQSLIHLAGGDLVPAEILNITPGQVSFFSPATLTSSLPSSMVEAIFLPAPPLQIETFADPGWTQLSGQPGALNPDAPDTLQLQPGTVAGHPSILHSDTMQFVIQRESEMPSCLRITLFLPDLNAAEQPMRLMLAMIGDEIHCGDELREGNLRRQAQLPLAAGDVRVRLLFQESVTRVFVNDRFLVSLPVNAAQRGGPGLLFESASLWGNQAQPLRLSGFRVEPALLGRRIPMIDSETRSQALTIPRRHTAQPPSHVLLSRQGDLLRGTVSGINEANQLLMSWGLENWEIPMERAAVVLPLSPAASETAPEAGGELAAKPASPPAQPHWLVLRDGASMGVTFKRWTADSLSARHPVLGHIRIPMTDIAAAWLRRQPKQTDAIAATQNWRWTAAAEPAIASSPEPSATAEGPAAGATAPEFTLPRIAGEEFTLAGTRGKIVVLDFWATWCGPCLRAIPELIEAMQALPSDEVLLIGVNQAEPADAVKTFVESRGWKFDVVIDQDQAVGRKFRVASIPHTVVIGRDGVIAHVQTGHTADSTRRLVERVQALLNTPP